MKISKEELILIKETLKRYLPPSAEVYAFGSRIDGTARADSDLDLLIKDKDRIPGNTMEFIKEAFEESNLPFKVDVVDYHRITTEFKNIIFKNSVKLEM